MQQAKQWGVLVGNPNPLQAGKCLLQLFNQVPDVKQTQVYFNYSKINGQISLSQQGEDSQKIELLHGSQCPCLNRNLQPNDQNYKSIRLATVAMLCDNHQNFLLTRRHQKLKSFPKAWVFPGGMVEYQQNLEEECLREVQEETGIDVHALVDSIQLKILYESIYPVYLESDQYPQKQTLVAFYQVKLNTHKDDIVVKVQESEVDDYKWINEQDLIKLMNCVSVNGYEDLLGIYPNEIQQGIGEGHALSFKHCYQ